MWELHVLLSGENRPVEFASQTLSKAERQFIPIEEGSTGYNISGKEVVPVLIRI